jgi:malate synthase
MTTRFQLDEIIYELRNHMAGLNCGRWDDIFSYVKIFKKHKNFRVSIREQVTTSSPFMSSYSLLVIQKCHKINVHAMGSRDAKIPIKNDEIANNAVFAKVKTDKESEVRNGHDGAWGYILDWLL